MVVTAAASESSNIDEDFGAGSWVCLGSWLGLGSSPVACNWEFVRELMKKLLQATPKPCSVSAAMKTESGIDVTKKEEYLSAEDFMTVKPPLELSGHFPCDAHDRICKEGGIVELFLKSD